MGKFIDSSRRQYAPVGECIYCGSRHDLRREHIIPQSLGGSWVLPKSTCEVCAGITRDFEQDVARKMFSALRHQFGFPSSTHKKRGGVRSVRLTIKKSGSTVTEDFPAHDMPVLPVLMPTYKAPGILFNGPPNIVFSRQMTALVWHPPEDQRQRGSIREQLVTPDVTDIFHHMIIPQAAFCRMLAKIAHAATIAHYGLGAAPSILADYILGKNPHLPYVVGGTTMQCRNLPDSLHWGVEFGTHDRGDQRFLTVKIELFRFLFLQGIKGGRGPVYWITVCPADQRLVELSANGPQYPLDHKKQRS